MTPQETLDKAEEICKAVDGLIEVIKKGDFNIDYDDFNKSETHQYSYQDKEYKFKDWRLLTVLDVGGRFDGEEVVIERYRMFDVELFNEDGQQALIGDQIDRIEKAILKTVRK